LHATQHGLIASSKCNAGPAPKTMTRATRAHASTATALSRLLSSPSALARCCAVQRKENDTALQRTSGLGTGRLALLDWHGHVAGLRLRGAYLCSMLHVVHYRDVAYRHAWCIGLLIVGQMESSSCATERLSAGRASIALDGPEHKLHSINRRQVPRAVSPAAVLRSAASRSDGSRRRGSLAGRPRGGEVDRGRARRPGGAYLLLSSLPSSIRFNMFSFLCACIQAPRHPLSSVLGSRAGVGQQAEPPTPVYAALTPCVASTMHGTACISIDQRPHGLLPGYIQVACGSGILFGSSRHHIFRRTLVQSFLVSIGPTGVAAAVCLEG